MAPQQDVSDRREHKTDSVSPLSPLLTGVNFKEVNKDNRQKLFGEIYTAIDTLAFTFGNV